MAVVVSAPGKLMLVGEWAVLELGNPCIVMALDKGVTVTVTPAEKICIEAPDVEPDDNLTFAKMAIETVKAYLKEQGRMVVPFRIFIKSEISGRQKAGFGSSAATVVAIIKGLLKFHDYDIESDHAKKIVFKLSCIAHYKAQNNLGSCFDVAASMYAQTIVYKRFDAVWLEAQLPTMSLSEVVEKPWPHLAITPITLPKNIQIRHVFAGKSANTRQLVQAMGLFKTEHRKAYDDICAAIGDVVRDMIQAIEQEDSDTILLCIKKNRMLLKKLSDRSGLELETPELQKICDQAESSGGAAKFSGAGGGDCAIVVFKTA